MDQIKIGKFIAETRKKQNLTQSELAEKLNVSINAVSKWERGICLMDMGLLKPLSEILGVNIIDILNGEIVKDSELKEKSDETIESLSKILNVKARAFSIYGLMVAYAIICIYKFQKELPYQDIMSMMMLTACFSWFYYYKNTKDFKYLFTCMITFVAFLFFLIVYIKEIG